MLGHLPPASCLSICKPFSRRRSSRERAFDASMESVLKIQPIERSPAKYSGCHCTPIMNVRSRTSIAPTSPIRAAYSHDIFVGNLRWHNPDNRPLLDFRHKRPLDYIAIQLILLY